MLPPAEERLVAAIWPELKREERYRLLKLAAHPRLIAHWRQALVGAGWPLRVEHPEFEPQWAQPERARRP